MLYDSFFFLWFKQTQHISTCKPRKFDIIELADGQDGWKIETRKRLTGKLKGSTYKVYISPSSCKYYALTKAQDNGFKATDANDGRKNRRKKKTT